MVLVSDGISSVVSDQEIVDLARGAANPKHAATRILSFAEEMGSSDNMTAIVLPFAGWGHIGGSDQTKKLREYRSSQMSQLISTRCQMVPYAHHFLQSVQSVRGECRYHDTYNCRPRICSSRGYARRLLIYLSAFCTELNSYS